MTKHKKSLKEKIIIAVELLSAFICLVCGILWIIYPNKPIEPIFAFFSFLFVVTELYRRYGFKNNKNHSFLEINSKNTALCKYEDEGRKKGYVSILFYELTIVNTSDESFTVKDIKLEYTYNSKKYSSTSNVLITGSVYSSQEKKELDSLIMYYDKAELVFMDWQNIKSKIGEHKILPKNGIIKGSAFFILDFKNIEEIKSIQDFKIIVSDYSNNYSEHKIIIEDDWIEKGKLSYVKPRNFKTDKNSRIIYLD